MKFVCLRGEATQFIEIKSQGFLGQETISKLRSNFDIQAIKQIAPVLPVLSRQGIEVPFITCDEMLAYNRDKNLELWELAVHYERSRGALTDDQVLQKMADIIDIMQDAIHAGLAGTQYDDRILGYQSGNFQTQMEKRRLIDGGVLNRITLYTTALMESKSAMGLIVASANSRGLWRVTGSSYRGG